jgi:hypothetical protein
MANLVGGAKGMIDALVGLGLIVDDSDRHVSIHYDQGTIAMSPEGKAGTTIQIEQIE